VVGAERPERLAGGQTEFQLAVAREARRWARHLREQSRPGR